MKKPKFSLKAECIVAVDEVLWRRGLGLDYKGQKYLASEFRRLCEPYVPKQTGNLKKSAQISKDGRKITYPGPYARYQYHGLVMTGRAPKKLTNRPLHYSGEATRGAYWDRRMKADKMDELVRNVDKYLKGRAGRW